MPALATTVFPRDTWLPLTAPVPAGGMIQIFYGAQATTIRVYDCIGTGPYIARLGFGYETAGEEKYYPIPIGTGYPAGTPVKIMKEQQ